MIHKLHVLHVLNLFAAMLFLHAVSGSPRIDDYIFVTGCLVASAYWAAALAKLELGWLSHGRLYHALLAAYAHGWLGMLEPSQIVTAAQFIKPFDKFMLFYVLFIEAATLVLFWRKSFAIFLLTNLIIFHFGVFALYGFLFWPWMVLNLALILLLLGMPKDRQFMVFNSGHLFLSALLICIAGRWASPASLGWLDTRVSYTTHYTAVGKSGQHYIVSPRFFAPYSDVFTMSAFSYLVDQHNFVAGPYGVSMNRQTADQLLEALNPQEFFILEKKMGKNHYHKDRADHYFQFLQRYLGHWNQRYATVPDLTRVAPPPQFWSTAKGLVFNGQEPIQELIVEEKTLLFDDRNLHLIRQTEIAKLPISGAL